MFSKEEVISSAKQAQQSNSLPSILTKEECVSAAKQKQAQQSISEENNNVVFDPTQQLVNNNNVDNNVANVVDNNVDGIVDVLDFLLVIGTWGPCSD